MRSTSLDEQVGLLLQGTEYGDESLRRAMASELRQRLDEAARVPRPLRVYCGFDPRTADLHLGHTVPMRKMRQFQELGHDVMFVIGRFTSMIGDPSDQDRLRPQLTPEQATVNAESYAEQAFRILDPARTRIEFNDTWLSQISLAEWTRLSSNFTIQQFLTREAFRKRWDAGDPVYLHEFFYAVMQAYDAYHLKTDVQIGGSDQLFNIVTAGRKLMEALGERPNIGVILGILPGTDGVQKMSKSLGNHIPLNTSPADMFGKVMSVPDPAMGSFFRLVTRWTPGEIAGLEADVKDGRQHPRDAKLRLAKEIVAIYFGDDPAEAAESEFRRVFQDRGEPENVEEIVVKSGWTLVDILASSPSLAGSRSEARRLIQQGAVRRGDEILKDPAFVMEFTKPVVLQVGRYRAARLIPPGTSPEA
ncbi:MAG: tyrosine--tRNA ligase [Anaerolineales bacterium]